MTEVKLRIGKDGNITIGVKGFPGPDCKTLTKEIEKQLGVATKTTKTAEFNEEPVTHQINIKTSTGA